MRTVGKQAEKPSEHLEQGVSRRVSDFQFVGRSDKFAAIPKTGGRLNGQEVGNGGYGKYYPTGNVVNTFETIHDSIFKIVVFFCVDKFTEKIRNNGTARKIAVLFRHKKSPPDNSGRL
jgi:hypothetical protein